MLEQEWCLLEFFLFCGVFFYHFDSRHSGEHSVKPAWSLLQETAAFVAAMLLLYS